MLLTDFDYHLPPELIAQTPAVPRDASRLLHWRRDDTILHDRVFTDFPSLLRPDDLLVFNDTKVLRARLHGFKVREDGTRGAAVEALLLREYSDETWNCLMRPSARLRVGTSLVFTARDATAVVAHAVIEAREGEKGESWRVRFVRYEDAAGRVLRGNLRDYLSQLGEIPLPPYIAPQGDCEDDYQTVFAQRKDRENTALQSAAAPTAGLHFTPRVLQEIEKRGIESAAVTLQIGIGTFRPIKADSLDDHVMHEEHYEISEETAARLNRQKARGKRIVAIGTTSVRVLEDAARRDSFIEGKPMRAGVYSTSIFIRPGYRFGAVDALLTNFHLPKSSLLVMVSAFAESGHSLTGIERVRYAYRHAVEQRYRFFSFGDAMFIE